MHKRSPSSLKPLIVPMMLVIVPLLFVMICKWIGLEFNTTSSMPIGFYKRLPRKIIRRGDIVAVCLPDAVATEGEKRGYIINGSCANDFEPVLKEVIAVPGDHIQVTGQGMRVNDHFFDAPIQKMDDRGYPITQFIKEGDRIAKGYWLYGAHNPEKSWDSRYYGEVDQAEIEGIFKPVLIF